MDERRCDLIHIMKHKRIPVHIIVRGSRLAIYFMIKASICGEVGKTSMS